MPGDHVPAAGRVGALRALVRFLAGVSSLMGAEVIGSAEYLPANPTRVRFHAGVQSHVPGQHVRPGETPLTHVAQIRLRRGIMKALPTMPGRHVLCQTIMQTKHLPALWAHVSHVRARCHLLDDR